MKRYEDLDSVQECLAIAIEACVAARAYHRALASCDNDPEQMADYCTAKGEDLDLLYDRWQQDSEKAVEAAVRLKEDMP